MRLRFDPFAASFVRERKWHDSQQVQELSDGGLELTLSLGNFFEVQQWILSWGAHVEVLAPDDLRKSVAQVAEGIQNLYRSGDST